MGLSKVFLIDGTAFSYRAFYAIRSLSTSDGRPTNAVYGFATMLQALREKEQPDYLAVAFDVGKPTFRHERFKAYKVQRKPMPDPLVGQLPVIKALLAAYRIPVFEQAGYEAEDVLATLAKQVAAGGVEVFLVTGDKDALQLVNSHIKVYNPHKEQMILDAAAVRERYGIGPERMVDLMALMGDEIDNIPGVPGIGEKTAVGLLKQFESVDRLYERLNEIDSPARRKSLEAHREQVAMARELARIHADAPLTVRLQDLAVQEPDWRALRTLFRDLQFKRLLEGTGAHVSTTSGTAVVTQPIRASAELETLARRLVMSGREGQAVSVWSVEALLALAVESQGAWVVPLDAGWEQIDGWRALAGWLADPHMPKIGHDMKRVKRALAQRGAALKGVAGDVMVAAHLLNPARTDQSLSDLVDEYLEESLQGPGEAAYAMLRLHPLLCAQLKAAHLWELYTQLELPLLNVLAQMEAAGIAVDAPYLKGLRASMDVKLAQLTDAIYRLAGSTFNLNSPKQLAHTLFERLKLPVVKRTKTGPSTDSDVLRQLAQHHPLPQHLIEYRELSKLVSTYVDALPKLVNPATGRIHTSFNQTSTATGRLSSSEPNLQNIPIKTELGRSIRRAFVSGIPNGLLVAADYTQIELRILAHLSGDAKLAEAFREDRDIHRVTASLIYGIPEAQVQTEQRNAMKAVNYGILYGMSPHGLSKELGIAFDEAQAFIEAYFQRYPSVRDYLDRQIAQAKRDGFVQTLLGRRRYIPEINSPDPMVRQFGERMAVNAPIQGTAADLIKRAMVDVAAQLESQGLASRMVLQVHDELVFDVPREEVPRLARLVRTVMEGALALTVPLTVTMKAGPNWLDLSDVK